MNSKIIIGALIGAVVGFVTGWLIWGIILVKYFETNTIPYVGLNKTPELMWAIALSQLLFGCMYAFIFNRFSSISLGKGLVSGAIISFLITAGMDILIYSHLNLFGRKLILVDSLAALVSGAIVGLCVGWWMGRKNTSS